MSKPVILQVIPQLDAGGAELSTLEIVAALAKVGATALVASEGGRMAAEVERLGGELIHLPLASKHPLQIYRNAGRIEQLIIERDVSLLHARSRAPAWSSLIAARRTGIAFVTTYHGIYNEREPFKRLYNSVMARGDVVVANSRYTADVVRARHAFAASRLRVIHRGVDLRRYTRAAIALERLDALRQQWGLAGGERIVLHPARLTGWKGQAVVIEAARLLCDAGAPGDAVFILAGDHQGRDGYVEALTSQIEAGGLVGRVRLVGHCSDMPAAYALAHVTLVASIEPEAFGRTAAEAQALGCPVIATSIGAPPETVRTQPAFAAEAATGWLVAPGEARALAAAIGEALSLDAACWQSMGRRAIENVAANFSDEAMKVKTLAVYDELLGTRFADQFASEAPASA